MEQLQQAADWALWANISTVFGFASAVAIAVLGWLWNTGRWIFRKPQPLPAPPPPEPPIRIGLPTGRPVLGRETDVAEIRAALLADRDKDETKPNAGAVLAGQGGVGKSSLARHYFETHGAEYHGVLWARAETRQEAIVSLCGLSGALGLPVPDQPQIQHAQAVIGAVARSGKSWLIVFDNVEARADIDDLLPQRAHIIITTRQVQGWDGWFRHRTEELPFDAPDAPAVRLLMDYARRSEGVEDARALAEDLGGLPLALVVMGAFLREADMSFVEGRGQLKAILTRVPQNSGYPTSVQGAVLLSYERLSDDAKIVAQLCSFWAAEGLGPWLLLDAPAGQNWEVGLDLIPEDLQALTQDETRVRTAFDDLAARSLLTGAGDAREMHRMTAVALRGIGEGAMVPAAVALLAAVYPGGDHSPANSQQWPLCARLTPHVQALLTGGATPEIPAWDYLLNQAGIYLIQMADYHGGLPMAHESLRIKSTSAPDDDTRMALIPAQFGALFQLHGLLREAEAASTKAVAFGEARLPGSDTLANCYEMLGGVLLEIARKGAPERLPEAARRFQQALAIRRKIFGCASDPVARSLNSLSAVREAQGRDEDAERLVGKSLDIMRAIPEPDNALLAEIISNHAAASLRAGAADRAEAELREALRIYETELKSQPMHPNLQRLARVLITCLLTRARAGVNRGAREAEAKRLCAQYGFDFNERQEFALQYPTTPKNQRPT